MKKYNINTEIAINPSCMCVNDKGIWFINTVFPILYFYDFLEEKVNWYRVIPNLPNSEEYLFYGIYEYMNKLFLIPYNSCSIVVYDKVEDFFFEIEKTSLSSGAFRGCVQIDNILYFIPFRNDTIFAIDPVTCQVLFEIEWKKENNLEKHDYINDYAINGEWLYAVVPKRNVILKYNFRKNEWDSFTVGDVKNSYTAIASSKTKICFFELNNQKLYSCEMNKKIICNTHYINSKGVKIIGEKDYFVLDNVFDDKWFILDDTLNIIRENEYTYKNIIQSFMTTYCFACWAEIGNGNLLGIDKYNHMIYLDKYGNKKEKSIFVDSTIWEESLLSNEKINKVDYYRENMIYSLRNFVLKLLK